MTQQEYFKNSIEKYRYYRKIRHGSMAKALSLPLRRYQQILSGKDVLTDEEFEEIQQLMISLKLKDKEKNADLKIVRQRNKLTQKELALQLNMTVQEIKEIENNKDEESLEKRKAVIGFINKAKDLPLTLFNLYYPTNLINKESINKDHYVVLDFEFTSYDGVKEVIEIGAIKYKNNKPVQQFHFFIKPEHPITPIVQELTGISDRMLQNAPNIDEIMPAFFNFIKDYPLVMHSARDDIRFVWYYLYHQQKEMISNEIIDTLTLSQDVFDKEEVGNYRLPNLKEFLNIKLGSHNALDDCKVTGELFYVCKERLTAKSR